MDHQPVRPTTKRSPLMKGGKKEKKTPNQEKEPVPDVSPGGIVRHKLDLAFLISAISC